MNRRLVVALITSSLFVASNVAAVGVAVRPTQLDLAAKTMRSEEGEFVVINVDEMPAIYQVAVDNWSNHVRFDANSFELQPGESRLVKFTVIFYNAGEFKTDISITARPLGSSGLTTMGGVKLPVVFQVTGIPAWLIVVLLICLIILAVVLLIIRVKQNRQLKIKLN